MLNVIEPILDHQFHDRSFGFRHERGAHAALRIVEQKLQEGYVYVVDAELKGFPSRLNACCVDETSQLHRAVARISRHRRFDTIPKDRLLALVKEHISDSRMLKLIKLFLDQNILEELREKARITELTPRQRPGSLPSIATELNRVLIGWFGDFRHCRWTIDKDLDTQIRKRLRRLLLKRHRKNPSVYLALAAGSMPPL